MKKLLLVALVLPIMIGCTKTNDTLQIPTIKLTAELSSEMVPERSIFIQYWQVKVSSDKRIDHDCTITVNWNIYDGRNIKIDTSQYNITLPAGATSRSEVTYKISSTAFTAKDIKITKVSTNSKYNFVY